MKHLTTIGLVSIASLQAADFELDLNAHLNLAAGAATTEESDLAAHSHDPNDEFTIQGLEANASVRYGEYLSGFISYNGFLDEANSPDGELEEAFLKITGLPQDIELRAGRLYNRATSQNSQHQHSWSFADANLLTSRMLGDEGLATDSVELSYYLPFSHSALISVAYGNAAPGEAHDTTTIGHHKDVEGEGAFLTDDIITARLLGDYNYSDFHQYRYGLSLLHGENGYGEKSTLIGSEFRYLWRENGLEANGKHFRVSVEPLFREFDYSSPDNSVTGSASEWGVHSSVGWGFRDNWELGARFDYLEGVGGPVEDLSQRHRSSLALTRAYEYNDYLSGHVRLQYNHDWSEANGQDDVLWLQWQIDLGKGGEVR